MTAPLPESGVVTVRVVEKGVPLGDPFDVLVGRNRVGLESQLALGLLEVVTPARSAS